MSSKLWSFFISLVLFMTYGLTHLHHTPTLLTPVMPSCTAFADGEEEEESEEDIQDLEDVTDEEDTLDDAEEADEDQTDEVIDEMLQEDDEDEEEQDDDTLEIPAGSEDTQEAQEAKVDNDLK